MKSIFMKKILTVASLSGIVLSMFSPVSNALTRQQQLDEAFQLYQSGRFFSYSDYQYAKLSIDMGEDYAYLYEDCDYQGRVIVASWRNTNPNDISYSRGKESLDFNWDNRVSSIKVFNEAHLVLFEEAYYAGSHLEINSNTSCLVNDNFNDKVSSYLM